jgi:hypothetical protein
MLDKTYRHTHTEETDTQRETDTQTSKFCTDTLILATSLSLLYSPPALGR